MNNHLELDLGQIEAPLLVFSGPCSNFEATEAMINVAKNKGFAPDHVICTGDLAAYAANPAETVRAIREFGCHVLMGNCEESLGSNAADCGCGFEEGSSCDTLSVAWFRHATTSLDTAATTWMASLPRRIRLSMNGRRGLVIHGSVSAINQFVFPATSHETKAHEMTLANADIVIGGHSGVPFTQKVGKGVWHNSGIIGIPANDGTPRVWFSTLSPVNGEIVFEHHALEYDYRAAAQRIHDTTILPNDYAETIETGLWPSDDVMPEVDRQKRGHRLNPESLSWTSR